MELEKKKPILKLELKLEKTSNSPTTALLGKN
jgi:hypothetical protein